MMETLTTFGAVSVLWLLVCSPMLIVAWAETSVQRCPRCKGRGSKVGHFVAYCEQCRTRYQWRSMPR